MKKVAMEKAAMEKVAMPRYSMRTNLTLLMIAEIAVISCVSWLVTWLLRRFQINWVIPDAVWYLVISLVLAGATTSFLSIWIFQPITRLGEAMQQVAGGNFDVRLDTNHSFAEIRQIYTNFNLMARELGATEILQTDFVSNVSHEFKTPINAIEGYVTLLQEEDTLPNRKDYTQKILLNTHRLSRLVGNILLLSKVDNQAIRARESTYRLDEQIRQSIVLLEPEWEKRDIEFNIQLQRIEFTGCESMLAHVWDNLLGNAIKFSPQGGFIGIGLHHQGDDVVFTVEDRGPGIPPDALSHVFDRFYQSETSHKEEGSGLGLALAKQIVTASGGTIQAQNLPQGCRFTVTLP